MNKNLIIFLTCLLVYPLPVLAHNFSGMVGFYDGISHPVLGLDHFLAMISVGIVSAQIGGRAIWTVPTTFVLIMTIGGLIGFLLTSDNHFFIEVGIFGLFHGTAHGVEAPAAANTLLFVLGFICGTTALHLFGVGIGYFSIKTTISSILLRLSGILFSIYGFYLLAQIF